MDNLYKILFDLALNDSESKLLFEMPSGDIFVVKFSHLDIDIKNAIDEYVESKGLIYKIEKVLVKIEYDYENIYIKVTRDYLPKTVELISDDIIN